MLRRTRRCASRPRSPPCSRGCTARYWLGETCSPSRCARPGGWSGSPTVTRGTGRDSQTPGGPRRGGAPGGRRARSRGARRGSRRVWIPPRGRGGEAADLLEDSLAVYLLAVDPARRRQGLGGALLAALLTETWKPAWLVTRDEPTPARALYAQGGWRPVGHGPDAPNGRPGLVLLHD